MNEQETLDFPQYKDILKEVGKQIALRKKSIFQRTAVIISPMVIVLVGFFAFSFMLNTSGSDLGGTVLILAAIFGGFIGIPYVIIMRHIFSIEKIIWVDSYFDKKNLTTKESWRIARKLFFPALKLKIYIYFRYYLLALLIYLLTLYLITGFATSQSIEKYLLLSDSNKLALIAFVYLVGAVLLWAYYRYRIRVKLKFIWFIFLDTYHPDSFSYKMLIQEMNKLNEINKTESFKKSLSVAFGTDVIREITFIVFNSIQTGVAMLGREATAAGIILRYGAEETSKQFIHFAEIAAFYILYKYTRSVHYNKPQKVNEYIYQD